MMNLRFIKLVENTSFSPRYPDLIIGITIYDLWDFEQTP